MNNHITQISLTNFQIFEKLSIDLCEGFNCITGNNNEGKSTIMRAVEWVFTNTPSGDWMCRRDEHGTIFPATVKMVFSDGNIIKRVKGPNKNYYMLNENEYHEINRNIPVEVEQVLGINKILFKEIKQLPNISSQDEQPFLIFDSKPDKGRAINILTGTNLAERALKSYNKDRLQLSREITFNQKNLNELKETIKSYRYLKNVDKMAVEANLLGNSMVKRLEELNKLTTLVSGYAEHIRVVESYDVLRKYYGELDKLEAMQNDFVAMKVTLDKLKYLKKQHDAIKGFQEPFDEDFDKLVVQCDKCHKIRSERSRMLDLMDSYKAASARLAECDKKVKGLKRQLTGKICPMCNGKGKL